MEEKATEAVVAACERNINKLFCLIVFVVLVSSVLFQIWDKRNIIRSGGYDYKSEGQRRSSKIGVIGDLSADVVIVWVGDIPGDGRQRAEEQSLKNDKNKQKQSIGSRNIPHGILMLMNNIRKRKRKNTKCKMQSDKCKSPAAVRW